LAAALRIVPTAVGCKLEFTGLWRRTKLALIPALV
jgi:hypothetical protein